MVSETPPCRPGAQAITVALSQPQPDTTVCTVWQDQRAGDTTPVLSDGLAGVRRDEHAHLVIDLSAVTAMDSAGLFVLFEARHKHNLGGGGHLAAVAPKSQAIPQLYVVSLKRPLICTTAWPKPSTPDQRGGRQMKEFPSDRRLPTSASELVRDH
jgi:ABC-type transporter Mla MlaB component